MRVLGPLLVLVVLLAGCTGNPPSDDDGTPVPVTGTGARDGPPGTPVDPDEPVAAAPAWQAGDWWRWRLEPLDHEAYEATTVVTAVGESHYRIGFTDIDAGLRTMFFHFVPMGIVSKAELSWDAHNQPLAWLEFPLTEGKNWTGDHWLSDLTFGATWGPIMSPGPAMDGFIVVGHTTDGSEQVRLHWSPELQSFTRIEVRLWSPEPWLTVTLEAHGRGHAEAVQVLEYELAWGEAFSWANTIEAQRPPPAPRTFTFGEATTHVSIGCYAGGAPGTYGFGLTNGLDTYACRRDGTDDAAHLLLSYGPVAAGNWVGGYFGAGQGFVFSELTLVRAVEETVAA